jgi:flagellar basal body-associated protein FliL
MKKLLLLAMIGVGVYVLWRGVAAAKEETANAPKFKTALPPGAVLTGQTQTTTNGRSPDYPSDVVGYGIRNWAQIQNGDGSMGWVELA